MKISSTVLALSNMLFGVILTSCNSSTEKVENAKENVTEANRALEDANAEYLKDMEVFKEEAAKKIADNQKSIEDFNQRVLDEKAEITAEYKDKMMELDEKNTDMKKKMDEYKAEGKEKWEEFKTGFNQDMDDLSQAVTDFING